MNEVEKDLRAITADGTAWSVMVGIGETYLPAFVLALSASQLATGLVATIPLVAGSLLQLGSPYAVRWLRSYRLWVVLCAAVQAVAFVPLVVAALLGAMPIFLILTIASVYWAAGMATGPAWNVWVETLVPQEIRTDYFARRSRVSQLGLLVGFVAGGLVLHLAKFKEPLTGFALLFLTAAAARLVSAHYLARQREPVPPGDNLRLPRLSQLAQSASRHANLRVLLFMLAMQMAVWVAGPYFTPFMFVHLKLSYGGFVILTCVAFVAKILTLPLSGKVIQRWGAKRVLWTCGTLIASVPVLWMLDDRYGCLIVWQLGSGAAWGAYELAMLLLFFETIPRDKRVSILTIYNLASATAIVVGSLVGGAVLGALGSDRTTYFLLFGISAVARAASLLFLLRVPKLRISARFVATRPIAFRPTTGPISRPILPSFPNDQATYHEKARPSRRDQSLSAASSARPSVVSQSMQASVID